MTIGDILGKFKGIRYVYIYPEEGLTKFLKAKDLRKSELNYEFKTCEPSVVRGQWCLKFNL